MSWAGRENLSRFIVKCLFFSRTSRYAVSHCAKVSSISSFRRFNKSDAIDRGGMNAR
jgi:hypothetical protein